MTPVPMFSTGIPEGTKKRPPWTAPEPAATGPRGREETGVWGGPVGGEEAAAVEGEGAGDEEAAGEGGEGVAGEAEVSREEAAVAGDEEQVDRVDLCAGDLDHDVGEGDGAGDLYHADRAGGRGARLNVEIDQVRAVSECQQGRGAAFAGGAGAGEPQQHAGGVAVDTAAGSGGPSPGGG